MFGRLFAKLYCKLKIKVEENFIVNDCEEVHIIEPNKIFVIVKDRMIGERIYNIIKFLEETNKEICLDYCYKPKKFRIVNYFSNYNNVITAYEVSFFSGLVMVDLKNINPKIVINIASEMGYNGYFLDKFWFQCKRDYGISELLSLFSKDGNKDETSGMLVKYCHFYLSGAEEDNFDEFYSELDKKVFFEKTNVPYGFYILRMCYKYYLTGKVSDILKTLELEEKNYKLKYDDDYIIVKNDGWKNLVADAEDEDFLKYGSIKIFKNLSKDAKTFLLQHYDFYARKCLKEKLVFDLDENLVGCQLLNDNNDSFLDTLKICKQDEIIELIYSLIDFIKYLEYPDGFNYSDFFKDDGYEVELDKIIQLGFNNEFAFKNFEKVIQFLKTDIELIHIQVVKIFFKMLKSYLDSSYGELKSQEELIKREEVIYLDPKILKGFIKFYFGEEVDWIKLYESLVVSVWYTDNLVKNNRQHIYYDSRFAFDPFETKINFDYEIKQKYEVKLVPGINKSLPDGRNLVIFKEPTSLINLKQTISRRKKEIADNIGSITSIQNEHLKLIDVDELIISAEGDNNSSMYFCIGCITTPNVGKVLNKKVLLGLNNKQLMFAFAYFFSNFSTHTFYFKNVRLDENMVFYVNILAKGFKLKETSCRNTKEYLKELVNYLISIGYNPNAFLELKSLKTYNHSKLVNLANNLKKYCNEHNIYYSGENCPACLKTKYFLPQDLTSREDFWQKNVVFEDEIAIHYTINSEYNLKAYKKETCDLPKMKKILEGIVISFEENNFERDNFIQDCFIPEKLAYNSNNEFIGYIYKKVTFASNQEDPEACIDLTDLERMTNLHRIKALIRLLKQVELLINHGYTFSDNPFGHVFLSKTHKRQVQIVNIEFLQYAGYKSETKKWTCGYVFDVIALDENINLKKFSNNVKNSSIVSILDYYISKKNSLKFLCNQLEDLSESLTKYCTIHKFFYDKSYLFCPKCLNLDDIKNMHVNQTSKDKVISLKQINKGGESFIYEYGFGEVAKVFKEGFDYGFKSMIMLKIMQKTEALLNECTEEYEYILPQEILVDEDSCQMFGYVMKKIEGYPLSTLSDKETMRNDFYFSRKDILEILIKVGKGIEKLHSHNVFIGDLNGKNILFDKSKKVYFLDFDGMGVEEISPEFFTDGYIDPVSKKKKEITQKDDWYSFAVQAFYYLTYTHPFNGIYKENGKSLDIVEKMERRVSLLGNHNIDIPKIAEPWNWMQDSLRVTFYEIFEKELRVSIVPYLISQYQGNFIPITLEKEDDSRKEVKKIIINPMFMAATKNHFDDNNVFYIVNLNVALCEKDSQKYAVVLTKNHKYIIKNFSCFNNLSLLKKIEISKDECYAFEFISKKIFVIDLKKDEVISSICLIEENSNVAISGNYIYYVGIRNGECVIFSETWSNEGKREKSYFKISDGSNNPVPKYFNVKDNQKFVIVKPFSYGNDAIYCNAEKRFEIVCNYKNTRYNILFDELTKTWLVINEEGHICIIKNDGTSDYLSFNVSYLGNIENIAYVNGKIYFPGDEKLVIFNVNNRYRCKEMECRKIMKPSSKICKITKRGFYVITDGILYEIYRV